MQLGTGNTSKSPSTSLVKVDAKELTPVKVEEGITSAENDVTLQMQQYTTPSSREHIKEQMLADGSAQELANKITVEDHDTITSYGRSAVATLAKAADQILQNNDANYVTGTGTIIKRMNKIMERVNPSSDKKVLGILPMPSVPASAPKKLKKILSDYNSVEGDLGKIVQELTAYQEQIVANADNLRILYDGGYQSYIELCQHSIAGELALDAVKAELDDLNVQAQSGDPAIALALQEKTKGYQLLQQRVASLRSMEQVALQCLPIASALRFGDEALYSKIDDAIFGSITVFKTAIAQASMIQRQAIMTSAMEAIDANINKALADNAKNVADNMRRTAALGSPSVKVETIEKAWNDIFEGMKDAADIQATVSKQREEDAKKLDQLTQTYHARLQEAISKG